MGRLCTRLPQRSLGGVENGVGVVACLVSDACGEKVHRAVEHAITSRSLDELNVSSADHGMRAQCVVQQNGTEVRVCVAVARMPHATRSAGIASGVSLPSCKAALGGTVPCSRPVAAVVPRAWLAVRCLSLAMGLSGRAFCGESAIYLRSWVTWHPVPASM